ncbi:glycosyltransferase family 39 protein [Haloarculaceae archaeon H-GB11]|nr:glycosyltransferase family 39 protein [Haloarculaceae archaeon H-GB11]
MQPWFFVQDGARLYAKYTPVAAGVFGLGVAVGVPRLSLALVAAGNAALLALLVREAFDERTGLLSVAFLVGSPLFLLTSSVFLSYAPTTLFNLAFALGYVRAQRSGSRAAAALAGLAVGLAFFSRPYTAVLFALPFVGHALVSLWRSYGTDRWRATVERVGLVGALGAAFVGVTLAYNAVVTGSAFVFPYQAFAPADGLGFGRRQILGYERVYTPSLALEANARVLWQFATNWSTVPPLGVLAALVGIAGLARDAVTGREQSAGGRTANDADLSDRTVRTLLAGVALSVVVGNVYFWGNLNVLAALEDPTDGLVSLLGPFYHFDLLVPFAAFAAAGAISTVEGVREVLRRRYSASVARRIVLVLLVVTVPIVGAVEAGALGPPVERNEAYTERYERAYAPFEDRTFANALVFVPTPYGDWLNHPFQSLRNEPSLAGERMFVLDRDAAGDVAALTAYPDRQPYRYTYRGEWSPTPADDEPIVPVLEPLSVREGDSHRIQTRVGRVVGAETASVRLAADGRAIQYGVERLPDETLAVTWVVTGRNVSVVEDGLRRNDDADSLTLDGPTEVVLSITFTQFGGATVTYRQELTVEPTDDGARIVWPPETRVCRLTPDCGYEGTYVAGTGDYVGGVAVNASVQTD